MLTNISLVLECFGIAIYSLLFRIKYCTTW